MPDAFEKDAQKLSILTCRKDITYDSLLCKELLQSKANKVVLKACYGRNSVLKTLPDGLKDYQ